MILRYGGVYVCFKYNLHLYLRKSYSKCIAQAYSTFTLIGHCCIGIFVLGGGGEVIGCLKYFLNRKDQTCIVFF